jgi:hypothetical protein
MQHFDFFELFEEGIIVSEHDDLHSFSKRVESIKKIPEVAFENQLFHVKSAHAIVEKKKSLLPWFAALTSFSYQDEVVIPKIELSYFAPKETLDHELIHAVRASMDDSIYEEFLAFEFSSGLRKKIGPLFFDAWEGNILVISLLLSFFLPMIWMATLTLSLFFLIRLLATTATYKKGLKEIESFFKTTHPLSFALLLTQKEFEDFAKKQGHHVMHQIRRHFPLRFMQILSVQKALCS